MEKIQGREICDFYYFYEDTIVEMDIAYRKDENIYGKIKGVYVVSNGLSYINSNKLKSFFGINTNNPIKIDKELANDINTLNNMVKQYNYESIEDLFIKYLTNVKGDN